VSQSIAEHRDGNTNAIERNVDEPPKTVIDRHRIKAPSSGFAQCGKRDVSVGAQSRCKRLPSFVRQR